GAYGEIWMARTVTGALRAVKIVYRSTFESERAFLREFEGMSAFEPISRGHAGFVDILHVGRTAEHLYYSMELADDHLAGRKIDLVHYEPRTLKSDLARHNRLSAAESIQLGLSLTEALEALHAHGLTHRDIKPSNIIFIDGVPKLADIGLVAASGQNRLSEPKVMFRRKAQEQRSPISSAWANFSTKSAPEKIGSIFRKLIRN